MPFTPKVGQTIKLTGKIREISRDEDGELLYVVIFKGLPEDYDEAYTVHRVIQHAELVSEPEVRFTKEQVKAIEEKLPRYFKSYNEGEVGQFSYAKELYDFLDSHTE